MTINVGTTFILPVLGALPANTAGTAGQMVQVGTATYRHNGTDWVQIPSPGGGGTLDPSSTDQVTWNGQQVYRGGTAMADTEMRLRGATEPNHALRYGTTFDGRAMDGPLLYGWSGVVLGSRETGDRWALQTNNDGSVDVNTALRVNGTAITAGGGGASEEIKTRLTANVDSTSATALTSLHELTLNLATPDTYYRFEFGIAYVSAATTTGLALSLSTNAGTTGWFVAQVTIPNTASGTAAFFHGMLNKPADIVVAASSPSIDLQFATIRGVMGSQSLASSSSPTTLTPQFRSEVAGSNIGIRPRSYGFATPV